MTDLARLELTASLTDGDPLQRLAIDASFNAASIPFGELLRVDATLDVALAAALSANEQIVGGFRIYLDDVAIPLERMGAAAFYSETIEGEVTFGFEVLAGDEPSFADPLGSIADCSPPGADKSVDVDLVYLTSSGARAVRLVTGGRIENTQLDVGENGTIRRVAGVGPIADLQDVVINLSIPPGAGLTLLEQVSEILEAAGLSILPRAVPALPTERLDRELEFRDVPVLDALAQVLRPWGRVFRYSRDGAPEIRERWPTSSSFAAQIWSIGGEQVLVGAGSLSESADDDGPTEVCVQGTEQVTDGVDLLVTSRRGNVITSQTGLGTFRFFWTNARARRRAPVSIAQTNFEPVSASHLRNAACSLSPLAGFPIITNPTEIFRRELDESLDFCTVTIEDARTLAWYNPETATATLDSLGAVNCIDGTFIEDAASLRGVVSRIQRFRPIERRLTTRAFDLSGRLVATQVDRFSWYNVRTASAKWDTVTELYDDYFDGVWLFRDFDGCVLRSERFVLTERTVTIYDVTADNYVTRQTTELSQFGVAPAAAGQAGTFQFGDGRVSREQTESFRLVEVREELFEPLPGDASHRSTLIVDRFDQAFRETIVSEALSGFLPAATMRDDTLPDPMLYPNGRATCLDGSRLVEGCWRALNVEACRPGRPRRTLRIFDGRVEDAEQARQLARFELRARTAAEVSLPTPANASLSAGDLVDLDAPAVGLEYDGLRIVSHEIRQDRGAFVSQLITELDQV